MERRGEQERDGKDDGEVGGVVAVIGIAQEAIGGPGDDDGDEERAADESEGIGGQCEAGGDVAALGEEVENEEGEQALHDVMVREAEAGDGEEVAGEHGGDKGGEGGGGFIENRVGEVIDGDDDAHAEDGRIPGGDGLDFVREGEGEEGGDPVVEGPGVDALAVEDGAVGIDLEPEGEVADEVFHDADMEPGVGFLEVDEPGLEDVVEGNQGAEAESDGAGRGEGPAVWAHRSQTSWRASKRE